jgi:hypothetical protein
MENTKITIDLNSMDSFMKSVMIKKKDLDDKTPMIYLSYLCENAQKGKYSKERMMKIIEQRILALEDAGMVYIETDDDEGSNETFYEHAVNEINILKEILKQQ